MPIYTYECGTCGHRFEDMGKFEDSTKPCPKEGCTGHGIRVPSLPAPAQFNCSMPTYQRKKT